MQTHVVVITCNLHVCGYVMLQKGMVYKYASDTYIIMTVCVLAKLL